MNPHNYLKRVGEPPRDLWCCEYCKDEGTMEALRSRACTFVYPPCEHCGQTPECAKDCAGMAGVLSMPGIYVIGG